MISSRGVVISVTLLSLVNKKFVKLKSWLNKSCWQWKGADRKWSWFFDISFGSKVIAKKHKHTNERRSRCPRALCRNLLSRCHVQSISYVKTKSRVKCAFPMSLLIFVHMHACCQCPVVQNLLAVLIGKCWSGTGEHRPYIIGTGFWKFPKCVFCNNRVFSPMREECVSSWVSDSFVHRSSLSHRQLGWKSAYGLAAYGPTVSSDWSVPLSVREWSVPAKARC